MAEERKGIGARPGLRGDVGPAGFSILPGCAWVLLWTLWLCCAPAAHGADGAKKRIFIASSYHKGYFWSQSTFEGLTDAMLRYGYLDRPGQGAELAERDAVESSKAVIRKAWMDSRRRNGLHELGKATQRIMRAIENFRPDLVLLGDDAAANYIGNQLLDTDVPVVFWGVSGLPLKYGLIESMDRPGHNVTGVWRAGFHQESLEFLTRLVPGARTFAILGDDSVASRPGIKKLRTLARQGKLPLELKNVVVTESFAEFRERALGLARDVDAFFVFSHDTLKDGSGDYVDMGTIDQWYLRNIKKPEASHSGQLVRLGMLSTVDDSGYNQAFQAFEMAYDILEQGLNPARIRTKTPRRGPVMVNGNRARELGIPLQDKMHLIEELVHSTPSRER